jgi:hypothetical protein
MVWTVTVEVAFATQPMATTPTWTDVTAYVLGREGITRTWGRPDEFSDIQPSVLSLTLNNTDGRFTRGLASSPYYPNVRNGRRIRVSALRSAVTYRRFDGHVNEWPTLWPAGGGGTYAEAVITATDRLKRFGQIGELRSLLEEEVLRDATVASAYFPLSEPSEATSAASITKQIQDTAVIRQVGSGGTLDFGSGTGPGTDGLSAPMFTPATATAGKYLTAQLATPVGGGAAALTIEAWFRTDGAPNGRAIALLETALGGRYELVIGSSGELQGNSFSGADGTFKLALVSAAAVNDDLTHHAAYTVSLSGGTATGRLYLDGVQVDTGTYTSGGLGICSILRIGGRKNSNLFAGTISHVAAHSAVLSAARILEHYNAGANGLTGERTDVRLGRLADYIGIPAADRNFDVGDGTMGAQATSGKQPVEAFREVEAVEDGQLFVSGDGDLTFHKRSRRYNVTPAVTLTSSQIFDDLIFPGEDFGLTNDMTVTRPGGSPARFVDQASIDEFGLYRDSEEVPAATDAATISAASWRVGNYGTPRTRVPNVTVELAWLEQIAPSQVALLLTTDISTKLRLSSLPAQAPASSVDVFVEGGTETFDGLTWRISFNTSPGDFQQVWQLGVAGSSELGVTTRLGQ